MNRVEQPPQNVTLERERCGRTILRLARDAVRNDILQAPRDSEFGLQYVVAHCVTRESQDRAAEALTLKCHILWALLDAIHYAYVSPGYLPPLWHDPRKL